MSLKKGVSVVVCCYNSSERISTTLKYLASQKVSAGIPWEIVIVNNASTDDTTQTVQAVWSKYDAVEAPPLRIIQESNPGLNYARVKGVTVSHFEYIIFCDDDNWLDENYVEVAYKIMEANPTVGAAGGNGYPETENGLPEWFEKFKHGYAVGVQGDKTGDISKRRYIWGAGMVTRRSLFLYVCSNTFASLLTDRKGNELSSGGDSEYSVRLIFIGYSLYYDQRLRFKHFIARERLTEEYRTRLFQGFRNARPILLPYLRQSAIVLLSPLQKIILLAKASIKYAVSKLKSFRGWDHTHEATDIYMITGVKLENIDEMYIRVRSIYLGLKKHFKQ